MFRFLCLLVLLFPLVTSLRFRGTVTSSNDFTYIGKFAYGNKGGVLSAVTKFWDPINQSINQSMSIFGQKLVLFPDMAGAWDTIEDINQSCEDTLKLAGKTVYNIGQTNQPIDPVTNQSTNEMKLNIWGQRPHFWYIVLANCQADPIFNTTTNQSINPSIDQSINQSIDPSTGLPIVVSVWYDFELTNAGDMWTAPLSWEQHHIAEISITFLIVYVGLLIGVLIGVCRSTASMKSTNQSMYLLLAAVLFFQILAQILSLSYQMEMIHQQSINQSINAASWWFDTFSQLLLLISVMVLSINNHSVDNKIHRSQMLLIGVVMVGYLFGYIASFVVDQHHQSIDPSIDQWIFNNWGGYVLCALRICTIGVIVKFIATSFNQSINQSNAPSTRSLLFYVMFASAWLASFPVITLIASMTVSYWRAKFFYGVNCIVTFTFIVCQVGLTYRNSILMKSTSFKTMSNPTSKEASRIGENVTGQVNSEVSMIDMSRSPDNSNPSSPRSPRSPSQGVRSVQPV